MENSEVIKIIENLKGRRPYEEKRAAKLGFASLHEYIEDKIQKKQLTEKNLLLYAAQNYKNPRYSDIDEFYEDLKRFKYIKRLLNRYLETDDLAERLLLNLFIVVFVFKD